MGTYIQFHGNSMKINYHCLFSGFIFLPSLICNPRNLLWFTIQQLTKFGLWTRQGWPGSALLKEQFIVPCTINKQDQPGYKEWGANKFITTGSAISIKAAALLLAVKQLISPLGIMDQLCYQLAHKIPEYLTIGCCKRVWTCSSILLTLRISVFEIGRVLWLAGKGRSWNG